MYRVSVSALKPGMRIGRSVVDVTGRILLTAGTVLKPSYIQYLKQRGIPAVYVINELAPDVSLPEVVSPETRTRLAAELNRAVAELREVMATRGTASLRSWANAQLSRVREAVAGVVDEILRQPQAVFHLQEIRTHDDYTLQHSVDVCILSVLIGVSLGYDERQLRDLGLGAVLHDIGKVTIPEAILKKPGPLTAEERAEIQKHTTRGFEILMHCGEFSFHVAHVAYQHHERWCGGGYPRGLKGPEIHELARVVAVADVYDAMTSDRVYRPGYPPERALRNMLEVVPDWFDPRVLAALVENVAIYPVGTLVELNTGETAVVTGVVKGQAARPRVRVLRDPAGRPVREPWEVDLAADPTYWIVRTFAEVPPALAPELQEAVGMMD
ncbi:MAG: HD-GYP domain-containing protein [Firmicutes bacterium]|nr:HD-GYP domain-containing protein [Bacillota bacterium]